MHNMVMLTREGNKPTHMTKKAFADYNEGVNKGDTKVVSKEDRS